MTVHRLILLVSCALLAGSASASSQDGLRGQLLKQPQPPNVLLLIADDLGVDGVAAYGEQPNPVRTPNIDALATDGMLFRNCWASPGCSPTRATMLTGQYGFRTRIGIAINYDNSGFELDKDSPSLGHVLPDAYRVEALGKWHLSTAAGSHKRHPSHMGFENFRGSMKIIKGFIGPGYYEWDKVDQGVESLETTYATTDTVDDALEFIDRVGPDQPWFLWTAFHAPHAPYHKPPSQLHTYTLPAEVGDDIPLIHRAMLEALDTEIGRLLASIDPAVLANTVIIFIGDNGTTKQATELPFIPQHAKNTVFEGGVNVPLIVKGPGVQRGTECGALVNAVDLFDTIAEVAGVRETGSPDSVSLVPYFRNPDRPPLREWVYTEIFAPNGNANLTTDRAVRIGDYKLIYKLDSTKALVREFLFDLASDPFELANLVDTPPLDAEAAAAYAELVEVIEGMVPPFPPPSITTNGWDYGSTR